MYRVQFDMSLPLVSAIVSRVRVSGIALWSEGRGWLLVVVATGWFLSLGVRLVFPALLPQIRTTFGFSLSAAGVLLMCLWLAYAIGQFPGGILGDRLGERNVLVLSTVLAAGAILAVTVATATWLFFLATILFGFATALYGPTRFTILSVVYPDRSSTAIGITMAAGNVGNAVLPAASITVAAYLSWRYSFALAVPLFALTAVALWYLVPNTTKGKPSAVDSLTPETLSRIFRGVRNRSILLVGGVMVLLMFAWQGFTGFYPTYLIAEKQLAPQLAGLLYSLFFALGIVIQPLAGVSADRFGSKRTLLFVILGGTTALTLLPLAASVPALVGVTVLASSLLGVAPVANSFLVSALPEDMRGSGLGLLRTGYIMLASSGPLVVGALADIGRFDEAFFVLAGSASIGFVLCLLLPSR